MIENNLILTGSEKKRLQIFFSEIAPNTLAYRESQIREDAKEAVNLGKKEENIKFKNHPEINYCGDLDLVRFKEAYEQAKYKRKK